MPVSTIGALGPTGLMSANFDLKINPLGSVKGRSLGGPSAGDRKSPAEGPPATRAVVLQSGCSAEVSGTVGTHKCPLPSPDHTPKLSVLAKARKCLER